MDKQVKSKLLALSKKKGVYIVVSSAEDYSEVNRAIIELSMKGKKRKGVFVTLNKSSDVLEAELKKMKVDTSRILFIDGVSKKKNSNVKDKPNVIYIQGPESLTELSFTVTAATNNKGFDFILFDSMSTVLMYNKFEMAERFASYLVTKIKDYGISSVLLSVEEEKSKSLVAALSQICDGIVNLNK